jgi:actin-related protein 6
VIFAGSGYIVTGYTEEEEPEEITPSVIGISKSRILGGKNTYFGEEALASKIRLDLKYPISKGSVNDWYDLLTLFKYLFEEKYSISPKGLNFIINDTSENSFIDRSNLLQSMFLDFNVSSLCIVNKAILSLHATDRYTGVVVHMEKGVTTITPVYDGHVVSKGVVNLDLGREDIFNYLQKLLLLKGYKLDTSKHNRFLNNIIDQFCYVAEDYDQERLKNVSEEEITLPEGDSFFLGSERFSVLEILFKPSLVGKSFDGISIQVFNSIAHCDKNLWSILFRNIILSGENSLFPGLKLRLEKEINSIYGITRAVVEAPVKRNILPWIGESKLKSHKNYKDMLITSDEYSNYGNEATIDLKIIKPQY